MIYTLELLSHGLCIHINRFVMTQWWHEPRAVNDEEFAEMIAFVSKHEIHPTIDKAFGFENYLDAFNRFKDPDHFGKIVLSIWVPNT